MRRLFLKIFFWFCTVVALALLAANGATWIALSKHRGVDHRDEAIVKQKLHDLSAALGTRSESALRADVTPDREEVFLFTVDGRQSFGPAAPAAVKSLALNAASSGRLEETFVDTRFAAQPAGTPDERYVVVVGKLSSADEIGNGVLTLRILTLVSVIGCCSYWFTKYLTAPVSKLREAEQLFSAGRFDTRIGNVFRGRRDALAELALNFDAMADRVEALVTAQRRLMNDISHELRSPLARLTIAVGLARRVSASAAEQHLNRIEDETEQLNRLIGQLLAFARLNASEPESKVSFDLTALLQEIAADGQFEARARGCDVVLKTNGQCVITGKPELLRSAIENVVRNAIRYTPPSTAVEILLDCHAESGSAFISVRDRGPGVPEPEIERIFEPFYRATHPSSPDQGTGLGLAITQRATAIHGGKVWASNQPDGGLIVTIQLPTAHAA